MATFVFVHGAWHGGWCWKKLIPLLQREDHTVFTPSLTGLGDRAHLLTPDVNLSTHVQDIVNLLEYEDLQDVTLVGHSYGGMVISAVAGRVPERVRQLVYLDAFVPEDGQSLFDLISAEDRARFVEMAQNGGDGWRIPPFPLARWGVTDEADVRWMSPRLAPHPLKSFTDTLKLEHPIPANIKRAYISCLIHRKPHYERVANIVSQDPAWQYYELNAGHDSMVTAPDQLASALLKSVETD